MRKCVFCNEEIENKTNEHIIPQWLMKLTGEPNRKVNLGLNFDAIFNKNKLERIPVREFSFNCFQFPACDKCNSKYANLENRVKPIVINILNGNHQVSVKDLDLLLDWLDKIRIGLWLGYYYLNKNYMQIKPRFGIDNRLGAKDRFLAVYRYDGITNGVNFIGVGSPSFQTSSSCFALRINNYYFFNVSNDFEVSRQLGFPFVENIHFNNGDLNKVAGFVNEGTKKTKTNILRMPILSPKCIIFQPIYRLYKNLEGIENLYEDNSYIKDKIIDELDGKGGLFVTNSYGKYDVYTKLDEKINLNIHDFTSKYTLDEFNRIIGKMTANYQENMLSAHIKTNSLSKEDKEYYKGIIKFTKTFNKLIFENNLE